MNLAEVLFSAIAIYLSFWVLYLLVIPALAASRSVAANRSTDGSEFALPSIALIIPAHNMQGYIEGCLSSIYACQYPADKLDVYVVADHCSDRTADTAGAIGANVLTRGVEPRGKTYTLGWTFQELKRRGVDVDLYVILDATTQVSPDFLRSFVSFWARGEHIIMGHAIVDSRSQQWFARCMGLTLAHRNLQDVARERLSLSALVSGRGMGFSREYIGKYGWQLALPSPDEFGDHPTEDFRHGVRLAQHGYRVAFASEAFLTTPLRESFAGATRQGLRWERGRIANAKGYAIELLSVGIREKSLRQVIAALDAMQPPVAVSIGSAFLVALLALIMLDSTPVIILASTPFALSVFYSLFVVWQGKLEGINLSAILWAPIYLAWRCAAFMIALTGLDRLISRRRNG